MNCGTGIGGLSANLGGGNDTFTARVPLTGAVSGGNGADVFNGGLATGGGTTLTYQGGGGSDTVSYAGAGVSVQVTVDGVNNDGRNSGGFIDRDKVLTDVEVIIGSRFGDTITGDDTAEIINPLGGDDRISANGGADTVELRDGGRDTFADCGSGRDIANADAGDRPTACETVNR
ncbi:hypothetical protein [Thermocatellispora tengchongensis]|uniref:hypothetical protein n=1 Tax=Thermocatellispora tengchongensis TaxID=1073253 RepID=UPI003625E3C8